VLVASQLVVDGDPFDEAASSAVSPYVMGSPSGGTSAVIVVPSGRTATAMRMFCERLR
jgi:hypothetical protein